VLFGKKCPKIIFWDVPSNRPSLLKFFSFLKMIFPTKKPQFKMVL